MPTFDFNDKKIYYETHGNSPQTIILLNGIMMSTKSWTAFVESLSQNNTLVLVDFLDQGQSDKMQDFYTQDVQVEVLKSLFSHLNLPTACVVGISYGGEVALQFAVKYPKLVSRLLLFNTTASTSNLLCDIGRGWNEVAKSQNGIAYYNVTIPVIYSSQFYQKNHKWMQSRRQFLEAVFSNAEFLGSMERLVTSAETHNVTEQQLQKIDIPTLVVSSSADLLVPKEEQNFLANHIKNAQHITIEGVGHASMYETPLLFSALVLGFSNAKIPPQIG